MKLELFLGAEYALHKIEVNDNCVTLFFNPKLSLAVDRYRVNRLHNIVDPYGKCAYEMVAALTSLIVGLPEFQAVKYLATQDPQHDGLHLDAQTRDDELGFRVHHYHYALAKPVDIKLLAKMLSQIVNLQISKLCAELGLKNIDHKRATELLAVVNQKNQDSRCKKIQIGGVKSSRSEPYPCFVAMPYAHQPEPLAAADMQILDHAIKSSYLSPPNQQREPLRSQGSYGFQPNWIYVVGGIWLIVRLLHFCRRPNRNAA